MSHAAKLLNRNYGRAKARYAWSALGGVKAQPLVFRQGGAADRLFRTSFAGTALGGVADPERNRKSIVALAGKVGSVTGCAYEKNRRPLPQLVAIWLSLNFALSALRPAERGGRALLLPTRTYSTPFSWEAPWLAKALENVSKRVSA